MSTAYEVACRYCIPEVTMEISLLRDGRRLACEVIGVGDRHGRARLAHLWQRRYRADLTEPLLADLEADVLDEAIVPRLC